MGVFTLLPFVMNWAVMPYVVVPVTFSVVYGLRIYSAVTKYSQQHYGQNFKCFHITTDNWVNKLIQ